MKLTIRTKIYGLITLLILGMAIIGWRGIVGMNDINNMLSDINTEQFIPSKRGAEINIEFIAWNRAILNYVLADNTGMMDNYEQEMVSTKTNITGFIQQFLANKNLSEEGEKLINNINSTFLSAVPVRDRIAQLSRAGYQDSARAIVRNDLKPLVDQIDADLYGFVQLQKTQMQTAIDDADIRFGTGVTRISWIIGIMIFLSLLVVYFLTTSISKPINNISKVAVKIAEGDLSIDLPESERSDEVGVLSNAFRSMVINLRKQIKDIMEAVNVLTSMVTEISATTSQLSSSSQETATAVSETSTTIEEVKQTAELASKKAKDISENAKQTINVAKNGKDAVEETSRGIERISDQMNLIASSIMKLSEQSQAIGEITNSINDLAEQSNLLAVNASIEAVKAGEEGKGFSVIAEEIRSLAEQSKQATQQVREIIADIQKATSAAVMATEEGSKAVEAGQKQSTETGNAIETLADAIDEVTQAMIQIGASTQQQFTGIEQVNEAAGNISTASTQNLESTKQLETAAHNLDELGHNLKKLVEMYRV